MQVIKNVNRFKYEIKYLSLFIKTIKFVIKMFTGIEGNMCMLTPNVLNITRSEVDLKKTRTSFFLSNVVKRAR